MIPQLALMHADDPMVWCVFAILAIHLLWGHTRKDVSVDSVIRLSIKPLTEHIAK